MKLASGGSSDNTVPAMVSNGEAFVPPKAAKKIGYGKLNRMNQADKNCMKGFSGGGNISVFKGSGSGTSDSIGPIGLPEGSFVIRAKATKALGLNKGGSVGIRKFVSGGDVGPQGRVLQEKRFVLDSKLSKREELEKQRDNAKTPEEKSKITAEMQSLQQEINVLNTEISGIEKEFQNLSDDMEAFGSDVIDAGKVLRDSISAEFEALTGKKPSQAKVEEILNEVTRTGGKARLDTGDDITVREDQLRALENAKNNLASRTQERENKFGTAKNIEDTNISAQDFISQKQSELSSEKQKKIELESRASTATGGEKILLNDQIKSSSSKIEELNVAIEAAKNAYSIVASEVESASKAEAAAQTKVQQAEQNLLNALQARVKNWNSLSDTQKAKAIEEVRNTGKITDKSGKTQSFDITEIQKADDSLRQAQEQKQKAEIKKKLFRHPLIHLISLAVTLLNRELITKHF